MGTQGGGIWERTNTYLPIRILSKRKEQNRITFFRLHGHAFPVAPGALTQRTSRVRLFEPFDCYTKSVSPFVGRGLDVYWTMYGQQSG